MVKHSGLETSSDEPAVLDGFTIKAGNAGGNFLYYDSESVGGGIYIEQGKPVISNCTFLKNAAYKGGAIYNDRSDPNFINCKFIGNCADTYLYILSELGGEGGAIYNNESRPKLTNCEFIDNFGTSGAAVYNYKDSNAVFKNCQFRNNLAKEDGGGIFNSMSNPILKNCNFCYNNAFGLGGAISNTNSSCPILEDCIFFSNETQNSGGAIINIEYSEPNITKCTFSNNFATFGGGITNEDSNPIFNNCSFTGNKAYFGACIDNYYGNPIFSNCIFCNNKAQNKAGVMENFFGESVFQNCIFSGNIAYVSGGGLVNTAGNLNLMNCTLFGNYAEVSGNFAQNNSFQPAPTQYFSGNLDFSNCIIWNGQNAILNQIGSSVSIKYSDVEAGLLAIDNIANNLIWGQGNFDSDPCFVEPGRWVDVNDPNIIVQWNDVNAVWMEGDYHLKSTAGHYDPNSKIWIIDDMNSPCIDVGNPNSPVSNEPLPNGDRINMGAYGDTSQASMSPGVPLIAHWMLDEIDGERAYDSAFNNDANVNEPQWVEGKYAGALLFDGSGTFMDCGEDQTLSTEQMTVSFWFEPAENDEISYIFSRGSSDPNQTDYSMILYPDGKIDLGIGQKNGEIVYTLSNAAALPGQWTHIAVTLNGSVASTYINGQLDNSIDYAQRVAGNNYNLTIGSLAGLSDFYKGKIDEVRIYNRSLNQQEIEVLSQ